MAPTDARTGGSRFAHRLCAALIFAASLLIATTAEAQPFGSWLTLSGPTHGYLQVPHSNALDPAGGFTFEAWVRINSGGDCRSIAGKDFTQAWWVGICGNTLRSYVKGSGSSVDGGVIPPGTWTHIAVTSDVVRRKHYINGELVADVPETPGPLGSSPDPVRIGSDVAWQHTPNGAIDEARLWSVARTMSQIRGSINRAIKSAQAGLVAVWSLDGDDDVVGPHDGSLQGGGVGFLTFPVALGCNPSTATTLCLHDRFAIRAWFRTGAPGTPVSPAQRVPFANSGSGLFWFFSSNNWEIMIKAIDGCGLNSRYWIFSAATTNVFYRVEVTDVQAGAQKIYFNYPGPPAPAVTDTSAFATCP